MISTIPTLAVGVKPFWQSQAFMLHWTVNMAGKPKVLCYMQHTGSKLHFRIELSSPSSVACYTCYSSRWWPILKVLKQCAALLFSFWWLSCCHVMFISAFRFTDNNDFLNIMASEKIYQLSELISQWFGAAGLVWQRNRRGRIGLAFKLYFHNPAAPLFTILQSLHSPEAPLFCMSFSTRALVESFCLIPSRTVSGVDCYDYTPVGGVINFWFNHAPRLV